MFVKQYGTGYDSPSSYGSYEEQQYSQKTRGAPNAYVIVFSSPHSSRVTLHSSRTTDSTLITIKYITVIFLPSSCVFAFLLVFFVLLLFFLSFSFFFFLFLSLSLFLSFSFSFFFLYSVYLHINQTLSARKGTAAVRGVSRGGAPQGGNEQSRPMTSVGAAGYRSEQTSTRPGSRAAAPDPLFGSYSPSSICGSFC
jgi:hypothetical protein